MTCEGGNQKKLNFETRFNTLVRALGDNSNMALESLEKLMAYIEWSRDARKVMPLLYLVSKTQTNTHFLHPPLCSLDFPYPQLVPLLVLVAYLVAWPRPLALRGLSPSRLYALLSLELLYFPCIIKTDSGSTKWPNESSGHQTSSSLPPLCKNSPTFSRESQLPLPGWWFLFFPDGPLTQADQSPKR